MTTATRAAGPTLARIRAGGVVRAAVSRGILGLSYPQADGTWHGLDAEIARAVAAAAAGDPGAVRWQPVDPADRLAALAGGEVDIVTANLTATLPREVTHPVLFAGVTCYDGEGFLVRATDPAQVPADLAGRVVAIQQGTTSAANLARYLEPRGLAATPVSYPTPERARRAYQAGECDAYLLDRTALAGERALLSDPAAHRLLDETISREPMALAVRDDDPGWFRLCRWVLNLLLGLEHARRTAPARAGVDARVALAAAAGRSGAALGLDEAWAARVLAAVGDYGEIYHRTLGDGSPLGLPRGLNELWIAGGLHYPLPLA